MALEPTSPLAGTLRAEFLYHARRYDDAKEQLRQTLTASPGFWIARQYLGLLHLQERNSAEALAEFESSRRSGGGYGPLAVPRERMVEEVMKHYRVTYERDESGWWVASVRGMRGCHTQGRTVDEARRRIREALALFVDNARKAAIVDDVKLPTAATKAIRAYASLRRKADEEDRRAARAARRAVQLLRSGKLKMSARDAARLLGLSHQRVHQLTQSEAEGR